MVYNLFTDGGSRGNPGPSATGCFLFDDRSHLVSFRGKYIGEATNNVAEYTALIEGLKLAKLKKVKKIDCHLDSELVVKQLTGIYKVKHEHIKELYDKVQKHKSEFDHIDFIHVRREKNKFADRMVNVILDTKAE